MRIDHPYSLWVRDGQLCWSCGQCPLDSDGQVIAPGDFMAQTRYVALSIEQSLRSLQLGIVHVAKFVIYYVPATSSGQALAELVARFSERFLIIPITVPHFYYEGMLIEIDVFGSHSQPAKKS
jgi:enamine deaminase RidA (YjgF/YER057c/UK114 family)